ncbi:jasmonate O-methyltransferase-like [Vigna umbellata]|uniref:jasmonate O-methyltransferase-like n=1 Tax=Vigna umbellata TaxID=87088 RepID=UPI001F5E494E|nr:jasmonate O-methyltransferase-like [Vigna umbellata]
MSGLVDDKWREKRGLLAHNLAVERGTSDGINGFHGCPRLMIEIGFLDCTRHHIHDYAMSRPNARLGSLQFQWDVARSHGRRQNVSIQYKGNGSCFINVTPGSFYGRLFPSNSINLFHSSNGLHWLSQDPLLGCKDAASLNKGHCHIVSTSPPEVHRAYLKQYQQDFKLFLKSRSEELVPGGAMVLMHLGYHETPRRTSWEIVSLILNDMLMEGLIEEAKLESFNIPVYEPTVEEVKHVIQEEESLFLERLEVVISAWDEGMSIEGGDDDSFHGENRRAEIISKHARAAMEPLLSEKFDTEVINELFVRFQNKIMQTMKVGKLESATFVMSIKKRLEAVS